MFREDSKAMTRTKRKKQAHNEYIHTYREKHSDTQMYMHVFRYECMSFYQSIYIGIDRDFPTYVCDKVESVIQKT